jgi:hypothetical protein
VVGAASKHWLHALGVSADRAGAKQLRQPRDVDGDPPGLVLRQDLGLQRLGFAVPGVDVRERLTVGVADDIAACDLVGALGGSCRAFLA